MYANAEVIEVAERLAIQFEVRSGNMQPTTPELSELHEDGFIHEARRVIRERNNLHQILTMKPLSKRRKRSPPKLVRHAKPGELCPVCNGKKPGRFYGLYEREIYNTKRPKYRYMARYAAHGKGAKESSNGNGPSHVIGWCYIKGSCRRINGNG